jgi:hypothetical protein
MELSVTPEIEADLRTTVASLSVKISCQELLLLALLPMLQQHQKDAILDHLDALERGEVLPSRLVDQGDVEREMRLWIETMRYSLQS